MVSSANDTALWNGGIWRLIPLTPESTEFPGQLQSSPWHPCPASRAQPRVGMYRDPCLCRQFMDAASHCLKGEFKSQVQQGESSEFAFGANKGCRVGHWKDIRRLWRNSHYQLRRHYIKIMAIGKTGCSYDKPVITTSLVIAHTDRRSTIINIDKEI